MDQTVTTVAREGRLFEQAHPESPELGWFVAEWNLAVGRTSELRLPVSSVITEPFCAWA